MEDLRMIGDLSELHDQVHQRFSVGNRCGTALTQRINDGDVFSDSRIQLLLSEGLFAVELQLDLTSKLMLNLRFHSPEHEWLENQVKPLQLMFIQSSSVLGIVLDIFGEQGNVLRGINGQEKIICDEDRQHYTQPTVIATS